MIKALLSDAIVILSSLNVIAGVRRIILSVNRVQLVDDFRERQQTGKAFQI
jgi:hypothetical protein